MSALLICIHQTNSRVFLAFCLVLKQYMQATYSDYMDTDINTFTVELLLMCGTVSYQLDKEPNLYIYNSI